jgi:hypothetical protein
MKTLTIILAIGAVIAVAAAQEKPAPKFDPFADPVEELANRAEKALKEKRFNELKEAAEELAVISRQMSDEISAGNKDVLSARVLRNIDRAEKLVKTMRDKVK